MNAVLKSAQADRHVFIYLYDDCVSLLAHSRHVGGVRSEIEEAVLVHGSCLEHSYVERSLGVAVVSWKLRVADRSVEGEALGDGLSLNAAHMPGVPCQMLRRILNFENLRNPHEDAAAEIHIVELRHSLCKSRVKSNGRARAPAVVNPVAGLYHSGSLIGRHKFCFIHFSVIHFNHLSLTKFVQFC